MRDRPGPWLPRGLLRKVLAVCGVVVGLPLAVYSAVSAWFTYREHRSSLAELQQVQAEAAASRISQFVREIEGQLTWATHLSWDDDTLEQRRLDALRLLRQAPAVTDLRLLDGNGRERLAVSRTRLNQANSGADASGERAFVDAIAHRVYTGPVTFRRETEPFMTLAVAGTRRDAGVVIAEVNLKHIWDVVAHIRVGREGQAYVVDQRNRLIAHPDISLVLRNTDLSDRLPAAVAGSTAFAASGTRTPQAMRGPDGRRVLASHAVAAPMNWRVFVEVPEAEAYEPLRRSLMRSLVITVGSLLLAAAVAATLSLRLVRPIHALTAGAQRIGGGQLDHRITIRSDDEIEALGRQFNAMAGALEASYADLERKVAARTLELAEANRAKSRLLAAASHDLRQPLHALNLLVAQLDLEQVPAARERLTRRIEGAVGAINTLFDGLLDISKLEAGVVAAHPTAVPVQGMLDALELAFAAEAAAKGLRLHVRPCAAWVTSDAALLQRIVGNLLGNAIRYTARGGVVVGCRRRAGQLHIEVWDTGIGIPPDQHQAVFTEFYQLAPHGNLRGDGLGLGLAIVARLCALLGHGISVQSQPGRGSCFRVSLPLTSARPTQGTPQPASGLLPDPLRDRRVVVIDNDERVLDSTGGLLRAWGCEVVTARSAAQALAELGAHAPDLVIADFHLDDGQDGVTAIALLRQHHGPALPALLVSGDVSAGTRQRATDSGLTLLDKPVAPARLRALASRLLMARAAPQRTAG